jgi:hypothetical protein
MRQVYSSVGMRISSRPSRASSDLLLKDSAKQGVWEARPLQANGWRTRGGFSGTRAGDVVYNVVRPGIDLYIPERRSRSSSGYMHDGKNSRGGTKVSLPVTGLRYDLAHLANRTVRNWLA